MKLSNGILGREARKTRAAPNGRKNENQQSRKKRRLSLLLFVFGMLICVLTPVCVALSYFPLWRQSAGGFEMAGGTLIILAFAVLLPLWKWISPGLRQPAPVLFWTVAWLVFYLIKNIAADLSVVAFWGMLSSMAASVFFKLSSYLRRGGSGNANGI